MAYDPNVARRIVDIGRQRGLSQREITAALSTGLVESGLQNISHGDRDSLGVFQQRPSQGWGSRDQITDVDYATNKFYDAIDQFDADGISGAELAARIQRPAAQYRGRYAERWNEAANIYQQYAGGGASTDPADARLMSQANAAAGNGAVRDGSTMLAEMFAALSDTIAGRPSSERTSAGGMQSTGGLPGATGTGAMRAGQSILASTMRQQQSGMSPEATGDVAQAGGLPDLGDVTPGKGGVPQGLQENAARGAAAVRQVFGFRGTIGGLGRRDNPSDHPDGNAIDIMTMEDTATGQQIADFFVANAADLGVKYVIFAQQIWSAKNDWKPRRMADRGSETANHEDHPHISFT